MTIVRDGNNDSGLFLADCIYPVKLKLEEYNGKSYFNPDSCYLKDNKSVSLTASEGGFQVNGKQLEIKVTTDLATGNEDRFEFTGTEK